MRLLGTPCGVPAWGMKKGSHDGGRAWPTQMPPLLARMCIDSLGQRPPAKGGRLFLVGRHFTGRWQAGKEQGAQGTKEALIWLRMYPAHEHLHATPSPSMQAQHYAEDG